MTIGRSTNTETRFVEYDGPEAERYEDHVGVLGDLDFARTAAQALIASWPEDAHDRSSPESITARALWASALVAYARCFATGVRGAADTYNLAFTEPIEGAVATHKYFMLLRDKHIAHSVGTLEQSKAVIGIEGEAEGQPRVVAAGSLTMTRVLETKETTETFVKLVRFVGGRNRGDARNNARPNAGGGEPAAD